MDGELEDRPEILATTLTLSDELIRKAEDFVKVKDTPVHLSFLIQNQRSRTSNPSSRSMTNLAPSTSIDTSVPVVIQSNVRSILPDEWDCKLSGEKKRFSLSASLERVEELRIARHVSKNTLLESGIDLSIGRAYQFYLAYRSDTQLALIEVTSISQLRDLGWRLEAQKGSVEIFAAPPRKNISLEPDLAYVHVDETIADVCMVSTSSEGGNSIEVPPKKIVCYRCNEPRHRAIGCMVRLPKFLEAGKRQPTLLNDRVLWKSLLGLLEPGASRTILGGKGWEVICELGLQLDGTRTSFCTAANGSQCRSIGAVDIPISLRGRLELVAAIVVPELPHLLILGADF
ncbi:hypothetical protein JTB14_002877 [Gonioctena quinquepunctata]|nr:hypothetical protein JTB14_002877 [Gonioctena quinquepunctata]